MRLILLVLMFLVWETWTPEAGGWAVFSPVLGFSIFISGYCLLIMGMRWWGSRLARGIYHGEIRVGVDRFNLAMAVARFAIPVWFGVGVFVLGWHQIVDQLLFPLMRYPVMTPSTAAGLIPGLFGWVGLWWSQYPVDSALREHNALHLFEADMPVFAPPDFRSYFINKLRVQLLFTTVPVLLILALRDAAMLAAVFAAHSRIGRSLGLRLPFSDTMESALSFGPAVVVILFSPLVLRRILHTQPLPESRLRRSLSAIADKTGVAYREILLWRTQNNTGNAAVMGLIPRVRFVMLSDLLLESMTDLQIQAVFAHELGHVKHRHLVWFVAFFVTAISCLTIIGGAFEGMLHPQGNWREAYDLLSVLATAAVLITVFGYMSRWFERQADVFAARTIQRWADLATEIPDMPQPAPPNIGTDVFASALHRVAVVNNIPVHARNWTHGSIESRVRYIRQFGRDPQTAARFDRASRRIFVILLAIIAVCGALSAVVMVKGMQLQTGSP